ncbi:isochorismatase family protein [Plastoroseomonas hellenica]|uniref:isochorismatase family protein n=1 Tax=Plastoroseomonas hellenica TaxID=2687306 RepID=UPI001BAC3ECC|nr:isochorismatase family protein [Plastoroseomonas hellenica]MBR0645057.1 isochorismatase family protein [Plastoroseomonas hellenica]
MQRFALDPVRDLLLIVDPQPTFMELCPDELPVPGAEAVIPVVNRILTGPIARAVVTQDWHDPAHLSFASQHPGKRAYEEVALPYGAQTLWPDHGVRATPGAAVHPALDQAKVVLVLRKGYRRTIDSYSGFRENDRATGTGLAEWLRAVGVTRLFITGITRPYCIDYSAADAAELGFDTFVVEDACSRLGADAALDESRRRLESLGVRFIGSAALLPA